VILPPPDAGPTFPACQGVPPPTSVILG